MPMNWGDAPVWSAMEKVCAGSLDKALRGSFKSFRILSPVFVTVATTFRLATVLMDFGPIFLYVSHFAVDGVIYAAYTNR